MDAPEEMAVAIALERSASTRRRRLPSRSRPRRSSGSRQLFALSLADLLAHRQGFRSALPVRRHSYAGARSRNINTAVSHFPNLSGTLSRPPALRSCPRLRGADARASSPFARFLSCPSCPSCPSCESLCSLLYVPTLDYATGTAMAGGLRPAPARLRPPATGDAWSGAPAHARSGWRPLKRESHESGLPIVSTPHLVLEALPRNRARHRACSAASGRNRSPITRRCG